MGETISHRGTGAGMPSAPDNSAEVEHEGRESPIEAARFAQVDMVSALYAQPIPLEACLEHFHELDEAILNAVPDRRIYNTEILEELGASPFPRGGFPVIGFLATTYDRVSEYAHLRLSGRQIEPDPSEEDLAESDTAESDTAPSDTAPSDTAPSGTVPSDTAPSGTVPSDTAPGDTAPGDTAPRDTAPGDVAAGDPAAEDVGEGDLEGLA